MKKFLIILSTFTLLSAGFILGILYERKFSSQVMALPKFSAGPGLQILYNDDSSITIIVDTTDILRDPVDSGKLEYINPIPDTLPYIPIGTEVRTTLPSSSLMVFDRSDTDTSLKIAIASGGGQLVGSGTGSVISASGGFVIYEKSTIDTMTFDIGKGSYIEYTDMRYHVNIDFSDSTSGRQVLNRIVKVIM